jgi:hypothetical protein
MVAQSQIQAATAMGQHHEPRDTLVQGLGELQRWGSLTSTASSSDWNDIGLPPLPRQRSGGSPSSEHLTRQGSDDAASQAQQYLSNVRYAHSMPLPEGYLMQQQSLQGVSSGQLEALVFEAARRSCSPRYAAVEADAMLDCDNQAWEGLSPAVYAAAAALARPRRPLQTLHSSISMSSTSSTGCNSQPLVYPQQQHATRDRSFSHTGSFSNGSSPVAMDHCYSSGSARPLPMVDLQRQGSPTQADLQRTQGQARLTPQEVLMLAKLKNIMSEREQLTSVELELRHQLEEQAHKAHTGSPRAAAAAAAAATAKQVPLHHQQQHHQAQHRSSSFSTSRPLPQTRHAHHPSTAGAPTAHAVSGSPIQRHNSTAAALLAAAADPMLVAEYMRAHKQQQQQHQACFAAAAATAAGNGVRGAAKGTGGLSPAAMAKLRQLMALQQQQIHAQQVCSLSVTHLCLAVASLSPVM